LLTVLAIFLVFWFNLPPINLRSSEFYSFVVISLIIIYVLNFLSVGSVAEVLKNGGDGISPDRLRSTFSGLKKTTKVFLIPIVIIIAVSFIATIIGSPFFFSSIYKDLIVKEDGDFTEDIVELSMSQIPVVDRDTASRLGLRKLGEMSDLVSQFEIREDYTQINYRGRPFRVTSLNYGDFFKWLGNTRDGIPAYITVDMTTQETELVRLEEGIKYSPGEYLMRNVNRYLRFKYPTKIFESVSFEIDENGTPYWIAPTVTFRIALWSGRDIDGAVLVNAVTGEHVYYGIDEIPSWVDQIYTSELVVEQLNYNGKYQSGFFNSIFGQKGVLQPTQGYNYIAINDDVYLYTGMTSVAGDQSNVGFVMVNLRTKETRFYTVPGAEEYSAMSSAEGQVQHLGYNSTFPILLNVADRPTYFMSLKDGAGLVKMYAFVDVDRYQVVGTGTSVDEAKASYITKLLSESDVVIPDGSDDKQTETLSGTVADIKQVVLGGETYYYFSLSDGDAIYSASLRVDPRLAFLAPGEEIEITFDPSTTPLEVTEIDFMRLQETN
ncbi:MAG: CvpA family protein, partial [Clostridia bacterium]|nr:CvpA family protein [Clostridia bacterium]